MLRFFVGIAFPHHSPGVEERLHDAEQSGSVSRAREPGPLGRLQVRRQRPGPIAKALEVFLREPHVRERS